MERRYTVAEIDELRDAVECRLCWGEWPWAPGPGRETPCSLQGLERKIEEQVRTYMFAGLTVADLKEETLPKPPR